MDVGWLLQSRQKLDLTGHQAFRRLALTQKVRRPVDGLPIVLSPW
jgi:hypothetical protein